MDRLQRVSIDPDIARARTLPAWIYSDPDVHELARERVFGRGWQWIAAEEEISQPGQVRPFVLLPGCLDEPLLLTRDREDRIHCLSNVCTHRGTLVCGTEASVRALRCPYHGRRFDLDGRFLSMPGFEGAEGFPSPADDLPRLAVERWRSFLFTSLDPASPLADLTGPLERRCGFLPVERARLAPERSRDYTVLANWALYCDNYLEGFHIPFVHASLAQALDESTYRTELHGSSTLQIGIAARPEDAFELPPGHPDAGSGVAAYYWWIWPGTLINIYPWGISLNVIEPMAVDRTRVRFLSFVWDASRLDQGAGSGLDRVEKEDEAIVESVQRGVRSRLYERGRYSPTRERGVHHFHRLLVAALQAPSGRDR